MTAKVRCICADIAAGTHGHNGDQVEIGRGRLAQLAAMWCPGCREYKPLPAK